MLAGAIMSRATTILCRDPGTTAKFARNENDRAAAMESIAATPETALN